MFRFICPLLFIAPPAFAQSVPEAMIDNFAPNGVCLGAELILSPEAQRFGIGETVCEIAATVDTGEALLFDLVNCRSEGEPSDDRAYALRLSDADTLEVQGTGGWNVTLGRCTDL